MISGPVTLLIIDGLGDGLRNSFDAAFVAGMPKLNYLRGHYASTQLQAGGEHVGLPEGQFGNSEVGHMNIGSGRIVWQELTRIDTEIRKNTFRNNKAISDLFTKLKNNKSRLHLMGLLSDGGVHSHQNHLIALVKWAQDAGIPTTIHAFLDGRDTEQKSADSYLKGLALQLQNCPLVTIGSICGRYYAMDRDKNWNRVERAWKLLIDGIGEQDADDAHQGIMAAYQRDETDEFVSPTRLVDFRPIQDDDGIIFFNFRADRARALCHALVDPEFSYFNRVRLPKVNLVTFTNYDSTLDPYVSVAYQPQNLVNILGETVAKQGWKQFRTAETEKYAHVTYFFNGGLERPFEGENRLLIPSPKVATYELQPEMSAHEVVRGLIKAINSGEYRFLVCNLANLDMVGHTGNLSATISACSIIDDAVRQVAESTLAKNGALLIISDHGNCECMRDDKGNPHTAHTISPVPAIIVASGFEGRSLIADGTLASVAPTLLKLMGLNCPPEMTGVSLF